jgi:hypothetical protein
LTLACVSTDNRWLLKKWIYWPLFCWRMTMRRCIIQTLCCQQSQSAIFTEALTCLTPSTLLLTFQLQSRALELWNPELKGKSLSFLHV